MPSEKMGSSFFSLVSTVTPILARQRRLQAIGVFQLIFRRAHRSRDFARGGTEDGTIVKQEVRSPPWSVLGEDRADFGSLYAVLFDLYVV